MFCTNVYLAIKLEGVNLENNEKKNYGLYWWLHISCDLYSSIFGNLLNGHESLRVLRYDVILKKSKFRFLYSAFVTPT